METLIQSATDTRAHLLEQFIKVRAATESICQPLEIEDYVVQTCFEVSPPKWHLAHTTWFFEHFLLYPYLQEYQPLNADYRHLFNSYYVSQGLVPNKHHRGALSRPTVEEIYSYRQDVNRQLVGLIQSISDEGFEQLRSTLELGIQHEYQHQELLLMDIKHIFFCNHNLPAYYTGEAPDSPGTPAPIQWYTYDETITEMGWQGESFCFDNEKPVHRALVLPFRMSDRLITNGEYLEFIASGGYEDPRCWMADGWTRCQQEAWEGPLYWFREAGEWYEFTLWGPQKLDLHAPVTHVSFYEADAYARWSGYRLPAEVEWEFIARSRPQVSGPFYRPSPTAYDSETGRSQRDEAFTGLFGEVWQWTQTPYQAYPGFSCLYEGVHEYNGKFMVNQFVMRGGCRYTPAASYRLTYRNFFFPFNRWQLSGLRLACDV